MNKYFNFDHILKNLAEEIGNETDRTRVNGLVKKVEDQEQLGVHEKRLLEAFASDVVQINNFDNNYRFDDKFKSFLAAGVVSGTLSALGLGYSTNHLEFKDSFLSLYLVVVGAIALGGVIEVLFKPIRYTLYSHIEKERKYKKLSTILHLAFHNSKMLEAIDSAESENSKS